MAIIGQSVEEESITLWAYGTFAVTLSTYRRNGLKVYH